MFWALEAGRVDTRGLEFEQVVSDIQTLNEWATEGPARGDGDLDGRLPVRRRPLRAPAARRLDGNRLRADRRRARAARLDALRELEIVIPGRLTTAYLALRLALGEDVRVRELPFDEILDEGQLRAGRGRPADPRGPAHLRRRRGSHKVLDLGAWWQGRDRPAAAARRQRRPTRSRRPARRRLGRARRGDPRRPRQSRRGARLRPAVRARDRRARRPTGSSRCTSTSSRPTTATRDAARSSELLRRSGTGVEAHFVGWSPRPRGAGRGRTGRGDGGLARGRPSKRGRGGGARPPRGGGRGPGGRGTKGGGWGTGGGEERGGTGGERRVPGGGS